MKNNSKVIEGYPKKLEQAVESFGIDTEGKSDDELREAIRKATEKR